MTLIHRLRTPWLGTLAATTRQPLIRGAGTLSLATLAISGLLDLAGLADGGPESWQTLAFGAAYLVVTCLVVAGLIQHFRQRRSAQAWRQAR